MLSFESFTLYSLKFTKFKARLENNLKRFKFTKVSIVAKHLVIILKFHEKNVYNLYPFTPYFYIVKLGYTGVFLCFLIFCSKYFSNVYTQSKL